MCERITGKCSHGCETGYYGDRCDEGKFDYAYGICLFCFLLFFFREGGELVRKRNGSKKGLVRVKD